jgi:hypothetical protein
VQAIIPPDVSGQTLRLAILYDVKFWPFPRNNFAEPHARLWADNDGELEKVVVTRDKLTNMTISIAVNGLRELEYNSHLSELYRLKLFNDFDDELELKCTFLEFDPY